MEGIPGKPEASNIYDFFPRLPVGRVYVAGIISLQSDTYPTQGIIDFPHVNDSILLSLAQGQRLSRRAVSK